MNLELVRDIADSECTLGVLHFGSRKVFTMERPWIHDPQCKSGAKWRSCVSAGEYRLERHHSEKFGSVWALVNPVLDVYHYPYDVPLGRELTTRTAILIHAGNWVHDVIGCIAPGKNRTKHQGEWMVLRSRDALNELRTVIGNTIDVRLYIRWAVEPQGGQFGGGGASGNW